MSSSQRLVTPVGRLSYVHIFKPRRAGNAETDNLKYSIAIIFNKADSAALEPLRKAHQALIDADFDGKLPYGAKGGEPFIDGAVRYPDEPYYADKLILQASQNEDRPPQITMMQDGSTLPVPVMSASDVYSGCYGQLLLNCYSYFGGSKGIAWSLQAVNKTADGESLGGGGVSQTEAANMFANALVGSPAPTASAPAPAPAPAPPAAPAPKPAKVMTDAAEGTYDAYIAAGWTDADLIANGLMQA